MMDATTQASSSGSGESASSGMVASSGLPDSSGSDAADETSTGTPDETGEVPMGVLLQATFTIPAGATVEEFSFSAPLDVGPTILSGESVVVAVRDLSHPERDQSVLCPGSHPLDGCATVDYGAFGMTHDNRITFEGPRGPWAIHLYKDRSLQLDAEELPINE